MICLHELSGKGFWLIEMLFLWYFFKSHDHSPLMIAVKPRLEVGSSGLGCLFFEKDSPINHFKNEKARVKYLMI
jgi:hypothetical protein